MFMFIRGREMYLVRLEHIATGYPKQVKISFFEYLFFKLFPNKMLNRLEQQLGIQLDYEYFFEGVDRVSN